MSPTTKNTVKFLQNLKFNINRKNKEGSILAQYKEFNDLADSEVEILSWRFLKYTNLVNKWFKVKRKRSKFKKEISKAEKHQKNHDIFSNNMVVYVKSVQNKAKEKYKKKKWYPNKKNFVNNFRKNRNHKNVAENK